MNKLIIIGIIAAAIVGTIIVAGMTASKPQPQPVPQERKVGALSGPDIALPYLAWGGVRTWGVRTDALNQASTTACSMQSPTATTSMRLAGVKFTISSTTASTARFYKAALPSTATTLLFGDNIAANAQATIVSSSTPDAFVLAPNTWINVVMTGGTGTFSPTGTCFAQFIEV